MSRDKDFKRLVRRRMRKTGESYCAARARLLGAGRGSPAPPSPRRSREPMYPFEQFTDRAQRTLTRAQAEAEAAGSRLITTGHVLLALFDDQDGAAARVLAELRLTGDAVRGALPAGPSEPGDGDGDTSARGPFPSARVKRVIERAFHAAQMMGHVYVGTEHLLIGVLEETDGVGAKALAALGAGNEAIAAALDRAMISSPGYGPVAAQTPRELPSSPDVGALLAEARLMAEGESSLSLRLDHVVRALAARPDAARLLAGADLDALAARLTPPGRLTDVQRRLGKVRREKQEAINLQHFERAADLREEERGLQLAWRDAYRAWAGDS